MAMAIPKNVKITKQNNHDKMWIRATLDKDNWFRLSVTRSGWRITGKGNMKLHAMMLKKEFEELLEADFNYGDAIEYLALDMAA